MPRRPADPEAVARGLALLDAGDIAGAEAASGLHRATLYRARTKRDAANPTPPPTKSRPVPPPTASTEAAPSPIEPAPSWVVLATTGDISAGYSWTVRAMVEKRIDPRAANAIGVLLAGAARVIPTDAPPSLDAVPGLAGFVDTVLDAVGDLAGPEGVAKLRNRLRAKIGDGGAATTPRSGA